MPDRVGTRWEGGHLEVPVGSAVAVWRLISDKDGGRDMRKTLYQITITIYIEHIVNQI